jgi:serine/threonine-protein kinase
MLSPEEWAALKRVWDDVADLPATERQSKVARAPLSDSARRTLESLLDMDEGTNTTLDRAAHELLGFPAAVGDRAPSMVGRRLGAYQVVRLIGRGGMGAVYEAERVDDAYRQRVAIKTIWRGADSDVLLQRFRSERQILAALQHPNIAQLLDGGSTAEGTPWLAMEFVEGTPLDAWCDARKLDLPARLDLFRQVCAAVHHAHQRLVVHRDLKPSNILVNAEGTVKLLDFGVAKLLAADAEDGTLTSAGISPFTAAYAAPEQLTGDTISTSADVFALGGVLTLLLAGAPPRLVPRHPSVEQRLAIRDSVLRTPSAIAAQGGDAAAQVRGYANVSKLVAALRGELDAIAGMALRAEPDRRYASVEALSDDVRRYLRRDRVLARPDSTGYRIWSFIRRRQALSATVATTGVLLVGAAGVTWRQALVARAEARRAERATSFLSGLVTGSNATSYDPLVRLAPDGTLAQLLDSALVRIPREFSDDVRIRARLYTAIGSNLISQRRVLRALPVLDSARRLAADGYGAQSPEYARATLEWIAQAIEYDGMSAVSAALHDALEIARTHPEDQELFTRAALVQAQVAIRDGRVRVADSLAAQVLAASRGGPRSVLALRAEGIRLYASSWIRRDPRDYLNRARAVLRLADSLGLAGTPEQASAMSAEFEALLVLGRPDDGARALERLRAVRWAASDSTMGLRAEDAYRRGYLAMVAGDSIGRRTAMAELRAILIQRPRLPAASVLLFGGSVINDAIARRDTSVALEQAALLLERERATASPLYYGFATWYVAQAQQATGRHAEALKTVEEGERWIRKAPDLESVLPLLRRVRYNVYLATGRTAQADSMKRAAPQRASAKPCTPGGEWKGCPDLPP